DAALAAHLIRIGNSVTYGGEQRVGSVEEAVGRLGFQMTFRLVGEAAGIQLAQRPLKHYGIETEQLREHMLHTAFACEQLAIECGFDARRAYTAGLMRPLGLLVLDRLADHYTKPAIPDYHPVHDADYLAWEGRVFGIASPDVAAMVLTEWGFPIESIDAVRNQYLKRSEDLSHRLACLLNLASGIVADEGRGLLGETDHWAPSPWKLEAIGLTEERFQAAATKAREAFAEFQRRMRGEVEPAPAAVVITRPQPVDGKLPALFIEDPPAPTAPAEPHGSMTVESCN
ncbi:MAG: HDOD domain-containing protein, partial [Opitutus sp.]